MGFFENLFNDDDISDLADILDEYDGYINGDGYEVGCPKCQKKFLINDDSEVSVEAGLRYATKCPHCNKTVYFDEVL